MQEIEKMRLVSSINFRHDTVGAVGIARQHEMKHIAQKGVHHIPHKGYSSTKTTTSIA